MPRNRVLLDFWNYSDIDYVNEYFPDVTRDFRYTPHDVHPFMYFNFTFFGRTVAIRRVTNAYQVVTRCWFSSKNPIVATRSKKAEWHVYYHADNLRGAIRMFRRIAHELISIDNFDIDWYLPFQPTLYGNRYGL